MPTHSVRPCPNDLKLLLVTDMVGLHIVAKPPPNMVVLP